MPLPNEYIGNSTLADPNIHLAGVQYERNPNAEYGYHINNTGTICVTSISHTYGNVLGIIEKFLIDLFPIDYFKTVLPATQIAARQLKHTPNKLSKKEAPIMLLSPRVVFGQDENRFLGHTQFNDRMTNIHSYWGDGSLISLAEDRRKNIYIHGNYNRMVMYVDVVCTFDTYGEQLNTTNYIYNMFPIGHTQSIATPLELCIPKHMCSIISGLSKIPIKDNKGSVYDFLTYMNTIWNGTITYKLRGGSNSDEFLWHYLTNIDVTFQDINMDQGQRSGQTVHNYGITFTIRCDFNTIGFLKITHPEFKTLVTVPDTSENTIHTIFTDTINIKDFTIPMGWTILSWPIFKLEENENTIDISSILNDSLNTAIDYHLKINKPIENFINIQFRENGQIISKELFYVDWEKRILHILQPNYKKTYRMIITVCPEYINNLVSVIYNLNE